VQRATKKGGTAKPLGGGKRPREEPSWNARSKEKPTGKKGDGKSVTEKGRGRSTLLKKKKKLDLQERERKKKKLAYIQFSLTKECRKEMI